MTQNRNKTLKIAAFFMAFAVASVASASPIIMEFDTVFDGEKHSPEGSGPWVEVIFDDQATVGSVAMTINTMGLVGSEFISKMHFNLDPRIDAKKLTFTKIDQSGTFKDPSIKIDQDKKKAGPAHGFDMELGFKTKNHERFGVGESLTFLISGPMLIDSSIFAYTNAGKKNQPEYYGAAHIQGINERDSARIGIVDYQPSTDIPEPATALILGIGGVSILVRRKRKPLTTNND